MDQWWTTHVACKGPHQLMAELGRLFITELFFICHLQNIATVYGYGNLFEKKIMYLDY